MPFSTSIMPRVVIKPGINRVTVRNPFRKPIRQQNRIVSRMAAQMGSPHVVIAIAAIMPPIATMPPTDISAPPPIITMVAPITAVPKMDTCRRIFRKFAPLKKCGAKIEKNANTRTRMAYNPNFL